MNKLLLVKTLYVIAFMALAVPLYVLRKMYYAFADNNSNARYNMHDILNLNLEGEAENTSKFEESDSAKARREGFYLSAGGY